MEKRIKILVPTDFSAPASNAFRYALILADSMEAQVDVFHSIFPESEPLDVPVLAAQATHARVDAARASLNAFIQIGQSAVKENLSKPIDLISDIEIGTPVQAVVNFSKRNDTDLIVMGTRGERGGLERLLGSVAAGVADKAPCPVVVVPEEVRFKAPVNIAYATDVTDADPYQIWKMAQLLSPFNPIIHCVHFNMSGDMDKDHEKMEQMQAFFTSRSPSLQMKFHHLPGKKLEEDLNDFIKEYDMDMLVMYHPKRSFIDRLFHKSQVRRMAVSTHVPLLVQREA